MSESHTNTETLPEREQALLDTALLESDQLLARSLHEDDQRRRRRRWWSIALIFGGVVMGTLLLALVMGWLTFGQLQTADAAKPTVENIAKAEALSAEGWLLWKKQDYFDAAKNFEQAVELNPKQANNWNGYGWALFNSGQRTKAIEAFQKCVKLEPKHPAGLNGLGQIYLAQGELTKAEKYLKKAAPQAPAAWFGLARIHLLQGDFKEAKKWAEKVVAQGSADEMARKMLVAAVAGKIDDDLRQMITPVTTYQDNSTNSEKNPQAINSSDESMEIWRKRLLATEESDRWIVGANIGQELVQIPGDFPYELLKANWKEIPTSVRKQILKGFTPGMMGNKKLHPRFFDVMHLGMTDEASVRKYAATYIEMQGLPNFQEDNEKYLAWREATGELRAKEIVKRADAAK